MNLLKRAFWLFEVVCCSPGFKTFVHTVFSLKLLMKLRLVEEEEDDDDESVSSSLVAHV